MPNQSALVLAHPRQVIYFSCRGFRASVVDWFTKEIQTAFLNSVVVLSEGERKEGSHFNSLYDCNVLVILPYRLNCTEVQMWEAKVMFALKRRVYVVTPDNAIVIADQIEDFGLHPNSIIKWKRSD